MPCAAPSRQAALVTLLWFIVWLIADHVGSPAPLHADPVNAWTATLLAAVALDLAGRHARGTKRD